MARIFSSSVNMFYLLRVQEIVRIPKTANNLGVDKRNPGGFYSYNHYCRMYREWLKTTSPSMRQVHKAGEK
ncbi:hypothetical protein ACEA85_28715, partial [Escherichia coli]